MTHSQGRSSSEDLHRLALAGRLSRRTVLRRATELGLSAPVIAMLLSACGGDDEEAPPTATSSVAQTPTVIVRQAATQTPGAAGQPTATTAPTSTSGERPAQNQTFVLPEFEEVRTLDPAGASETLSVQVIRGAYDALVAQRPRSAEIEPRLATEWTVSEDAQVFTFKIRQGVKFHDGSLVNATAVKKTFDRTLQMNLATAAPLGTLETVEVVDDFTVRFSLNSPNAYFVENLTTVPIMSPTSFEQNDRGGDFGNAWLEAGNDAGSGPYRLTEFKKNEQHTLEKFDDYWRGWSTPHLTKIVFPIVPELSTRRQMVERGEAHMLRTIPLQDVQALEANPNLKVEWTKTFEFYTMPMNVTRPPLDNLKLRQALTYAFPYQAFLDTVWGGHGTIPNSPTAPGFIGHNKDLPSFEQDLNKAKQLLSESGVTNATLEKHYFGPSTEERESAIVFQDILRGMGITLDVQAMQWATMFELANNRETAPHMSNLQILPTRADPVFALEWVFGCGFVGQPYNWSYYCNDRVQSLIDEARRTVDRPTGAKLLEEANKLIVQDAPVIWYFQPNRNDVYNAKLRNFSPIVVGYPTEIDLYAMYFVE